MGFFDRDKIDSIDDFFDLNHDGKIDPMEDAIECGFLTHQENESQDFYDDSDFAGEDDRIDLLAFAGLDPDELEFMDEGERREALVEAGLDPVDFEEF